MTTPYQFPTWTAGQDITAGQLSSMEPMFVITPAATTRPSVTTETADPYLSFPVVAGGVYVVEFEVAFSGLAAADISVAWIVPTGTSGFRQCSGPGSTSSDASADNITSRHGVHSYGAGIPYGCARNSVTLVQCFRETSAFTAGSSGSVALAWAQNVSNATGTVVQPGSWGRCTQLQ